MKNRDMSMHSSKGQASGATTSSKLNSLRRTSVVDQAPSSFGAFSSFRTFTRYALSLMPEELAANLHALQHALQVRMIQEATAELRALVHVWIKKPQLQTDELVDVDSIKNVEPISYFLFNGLSQFQKNLDAVVAYDNQDDVLVIGMFDLQRALNTMARNVLYWDEREFATRLEALLSSNTATNEHLFRTEYALQRLAEDLQGMRSERETTLFLRVRDSLSELIREENQLRHQCEAIREQMRSRAADCTMGNQQGMGKTTLKLAIRLRNVKAQFEAYHDDLQALIMSSALDVMHLHAYSTQCARVYVCVWHAT